MELKVGMYVRYRHLSNTKISKIFRIDVSDEDVFVALDNDDGTLESFIINASDNIIYLIEVGDYVNGLPVVHNAKENGGNIVIVSNGSPYNEEDIKTIVTKEMFESVKHEVE